jgi:hypothetical protein
MNAFEEREYCQNFQERVDGIAATTFRRRLLRELWYYRCPSILLLTSLWLKLRGSSFHSFSCCRKQHKCTNLLKLLEEGSNGIGAALGRRFARIFRFRMLTHYAFIFSHLAVGTSCFPWIQPLYQRVHQRHLP